MARGPQSRGEAPGDQARHARAGLLDLLRLGVTLGADFFRGKRSDPAATGTRWVHDVMRRDGGVDLDIALPGRPVELVGDRAHSDRVLSGRPGLEGYQAGRMKTSAMNFLAPGALTIANGEAWLRLRPFNERVLATGLPHPFAQTFLAHVRAAFARPVLDRSEVSAAMGRAMVKIVLGNVAAEWDPAGDVTVLFGVVQSPLRRKLLAFWYRKRRGRLYELLARKWEQSA